jgi:hypothetical protein
MEEEAIKFMTLSSLMEDMSLKVVQMMEQPAIMVLAMVTAFSMVIQNSPQTLDSPTI